MKISDESGFHEVQFQTTGCEKCNLNRNNKGYNGHVIYII